MADVLAGASAPVVNAPVTAEVVTPAPDTTAVPVDETPVEAKPEAPEPEKTLTQSEVNKLVAKEKAQAAKRAERLAMERFRAEHAERELERLRAERDKPAQPQGKPQPSDFKSPEEYVEALTDWRLEQKLSEREKESVENRRLREDREAAQRQYEYVTERFELAEDKFPGLKDKLMADDLPMTPRMTEFVLEDDNGFAVGDYLADHVDEAKKIARLGPYKQLQALNEIAKRLAAPPKPTNAPPPIVPSGTKTAVDKDPSKMTDKEFADWRKRQIAQRGNR